MNLIKNIFVEKAIFCYNITIRKEFFMSAENPVMIEEIETAESGSKFQIDLFLSLGMYSLFSLICFWFPFINVYKYGKYDGRSSSAIVIVFPFIMFAAMYSAVLLGRLFSSLKKFKLQRRFLIAFFGIVVSSPSLAGGISMIVYLPFLIL
jgi:hypothetical protein